MNGTSRRTFTSGALSLSASSAVAQGPGNRIRVGLIGCGNIAQFHMKSVLAMKETDNVEFAAVCDVFQKRRDAAAAMTGGKPFADYRAVLEQKDIDYVVIATPEHWHAQMILDAAGAGKHVYCEKPMTYSIDEAKKVVRKVQETGVKLQVGVQGTSDDTYHAARKYIQEGALGKIVLALWDRSGNRATDFGWDYPLDPDARPGENLDWNAWLGSAPKRPWDPQRYFRWRRYWDYSGGVATDYFVHHLTWFMKALDLQFPERVVSSGGTWGFDSSVADVPDTMQMLCEYPGGPSVVIIGSMANNTQIVPSIRGREATIEFSRDGFVIRPQQAFRPGAPEIVYKRKVANTGIEHHRNLLAAIRTNAPLNCDVTMGYRGIVACRMAVDSFRRRKYMRWDAQRERAIEL
jgi:predicted dehydrogenase